MLNPAKTKSKIRVTIEIPPFIIYISLASGFSRFIYQTLSVFKIMVKATEITNKSGTGISEKSIFSPWCFFGLPLKQLSQVFLRANLPTISPFNIIFRLFRFRHAKNFFYFITTLKIIQAFYHDNKKFFSFFSFFIDLKNHPCYYIKNLML